MLEFSYSVGLPITLEDIGVSDITREKMVKVAKAVMKSPLILREPFDVTEDMIYSAIMAADAMGRNYKG